MSVSRPDLNGGEEGGKKRTRQQAQADAVMEFMKTADPATTECSDKTKAALIEAERDAERDRDVADVFPQAG